MSAAPAPVAKAVQSPLNLMLTIQPGKNQTIVDLSGPVSVCN